MKRSIGRNDEEEVTMKALGAFNRQGVDVPLDCDNVGYGFLVETLVKKGFIALNGRLCSLTRDGRVELARLAAA